MRHFEKKGKLGLFRRFDLRGRTLIAVIGQAGEGDHRLVFPASSPAAARAEMDRWCRMALDAGYAEVAVPRAVRLGVVATATSPRGPGRIRLDEREDVLFRKTDFDVDVGDRVMVDGVHRGPKRVPTFMFGSRLRVERVLPFPRVEWRSFRAAPLPSAAIRRRLIQMAGRPLFGNWTWEDEPEGPSFPKNVAPGTLMFSYEKGIHRFLRLSGSKKTGFSVLGEPVLDSKLQWIGYMAQGCAECFCKPVPPALARELAKHFRL